MSAVSSQAASTTLLVVRTDAVLPKRRSRRAAGDDDAVTPDARLLTVLGRAAPADLPPVSALGVETALEAMADASKLAVAADLDCWLDWCAGDHRRPCPADPEDLVRYLRALEADGKKPATLARRIASLATVHRLLGLDRDTLPTAAPMVRNALRGNRRRQGAAQRQAAPLRFGGGLGEAGGFTLSALLSACTGDVQGLRDAALLSLGYDAGLRVSELTAVAVADLRPQPDGTGLLHLPRSKTDQEGIGAWAWLSADTMRRVAAWRGEAAVTDGVLFRRVGVDRRRQRSKELADARWGDEDVEGAAMLVTYTIGDAPLTRQGVTGIYRRIALAAFGAGLVELPAGELEAAIAALSTHSLRVGLTQDLFAAGEDGAGIALTLRWSSPSTALRYGRRLQAQSGVAARVLSRVRT
ncbi:tyrosine-type recombinase/integrase [uncultured Sphingomonas sp.]|uniref:tyrosine-type recombinase/integrase n=1 Tax=uncultured Sphingomonas sp. TaxID=158754 RepID=UPI0025EEE343|nr:tyrosine-type recombinase/integrase [uncultured Sphingomonas sp.]